MLTLHLWKHAWRVICCRCQGTDAPELERNLAKRQVVNADAKAARKVRQAGTKADTMALPDAQQSGSRAPASPSCEEDAVEPTAFASPPCSAAEVDPVYLGLGDDRLCRRKKKQTR